MSARLIAGLWAALSLSCSQSFAADLGGGYESDPGYDYSYEEPRYRAVPPDDEDAPPRQAWRDSEGDDPYADENGDFRDGPPPPPRRGYLPPLERVPRFAETPRQRFSCREPWQIKQDLKSEGWTAFRDVAMEGGVVILHATQMRAGRTFTLRVDRCSGEILSARPLPWRSYGAYEPRRAPPRY